MADSPVTLLYLIKQLELAVRSRLDETTAPFGLTSLQYTALTVLERHPGITAAELARNSFVRAQTMAQTVTDLESRGFLRRERDPRSRRQFLLRLTQGGETALARLREPVRAIETQLVSGLSADEAAQLRRALRSGRIALGGSDPH